MAISTSATRNVTFPRASGAPAQQRTVPDGVHVRQKVNFCVTSPSLTSTLKNTGAIFDIFPMPFLRADLATLTVLDYGLVRSVVGTSTCRHSSSLSQRVTVNDEIFNC